MATCFDVANYFLAFQDEDAGDYISNLKLQKLVYYAQGFHLAMFDKPLFDEKLVAWQHGPVVVELYHLYKDCGSGSLPMPSEFDFEMFPPETRELLDEINRVFGQYSAWKLRNMTHEEAPWKNTRITEVITHEALKDYFKTQIN